MQTRSRLDVERAKIAPAGEFDHPADVLAAPIGAADKKKILDQWETDARALARAGDEGMTDGEPTLLREVQRAQEKLAGQM
jgi:hypothetical protein